MKRLLLLGVATVAALLAVQLLPARSFTDAQKTWLSVNAAIDGESPYVATADLARLYRIDEGHTVHLMESVHPRTPGALVLSAPLTVVDFDRVSNVARVLNVFGLAAIVWVAYRRTNNPWVIAPMPLLAVSLPMFSGHIAGNPAIAIVSLIAVASIASPKTRGVLLGVAAVLKLWPALIFFAYRDKRTWLAGAVTVGVVEVVGWMVVRPQLDDVVAGLFAGGGRATIPHSGNASIFGLPGPSWLHVTVALAVVGVALARRRFELVACAALLATPLSWPAYHMFLYPWMVRTPVLLVGWLVYPLVWGHLGSLALVVVAGLFASTMMPRSGRFIGDLDRQFVVRSPRHRIGRVDCSPIG